MGEGTLMGALESRWETGQTGHLFSGDRDILLSWIRTSFPLGFGPLILWDSDHLFS